MLCAVIVATVAAAFDLSAVHACVLFKICVLKLRLSNVQQHWYTSIIILAKDNGTVAS
jgi:hypothetical protein